MSNFNAVSGRGYAASNYYNYGNNITITVYGKVALSYTSNLSNYRFCYSVNSGAIQYLTDNLGTGAWSTTCASRFTFQIPQGSSLAFGTYYTLDTTAGFEFGGSVSSTCPATGVAYCGPVAWTVGTLNANTNIALNINMVGSTAANRNVVICF